MSEDSNDELGDFQDAASEESPDHGDTEQNDEEEREVEGVLGNRIFEAMERVGQENPTGVDPVPDEGDLCYDIAKPGAKVYLVERLAPTVPLYREEFPTAPDLDTFEGNVLSRMREDDAVFAAVYVKDSLTSASFQAYPMPESRLIRFPAEEADLIGSDDVEFSRASKRYVVRTEEDRAEADTQADTEP